MNKLKEPKNIISEKDKNDSKVGILMDTILLEKLQMRNRMEQASKPLYLIRYE